MFLVFLTLKNLKKFIFKYKKKLQTLPKITTKCNLNISKFFTFMSKDFKQMMHNNQIPNQPPQLRPTPLLSFPLNQQTGSQNTSKFFRNGQADHLHPRPTLVAHIHGHHQTFILSSNPRQSTTPNPP